MESIIGMIASLVGIGGIIFYVYVFFATIRNDTIKGRDTGSFVVISFITGLGGIVLLSPFGQYVQSLYFLCFLYGFSFYWLKHYL